MRCEDVRPQLAAFADAELPDSGPLADHVRTCEGCSAELALYRGMVHELSELRSEVIDAPEGLLGRLLETLPEPQAARLFERVIPDDRVRHAVYSLGGVVVGATAVALLWRRVARRSPLAASTSPAA